MASSPARIAANRLNSLKSTGPKTAQGKAASRLNAFQHGLTGQGDLVMPSEDEALVARRTAAFAHELDATGDMGLYLAHRVAILTLRVERSAECELAEVAAHRVEAGATFDADLARDIEGWVAALGSAAARPALVALEAWPDGISHLQTAWRDLQAALRSADALARTAATERASLWFGLAPAEADALDLDPAAWSERISAEIDRLGTRAGSLRDAQTALDQARHEAICRATFDSSPEATLARRYEATAERGVYRAIRAIAEINRTNAATAEEQPTSPTHPITPAPLGFVPPPRDLLHLLAPESARAIAEPLASFCIGQFPPIRTTPGAASPPPQVDPATPQPREKRPDLRKLERQLAAGRR